MLRDSSFDRDHEMQASRKFRRHFTPFFVFSISHIISVYMNISIYRLSKCLSPYPPPICLFLRASFFHTFWHFLLSFLQKRDRYESSPWPHLNLSCLEALSLRGNEIEQFLSVDLAPDGQSMNIQVVLTSCSLGELPCVSVSLYLK